ncbi:MAG: DUF1990 domain-containing protein [Phaeodactylibacter sp.]|nr:DUF1990 domain-containing protein [Phaeodactylibacter sp.]
MMITCSRNMPESEFLERYWKAQLNKPFSYEEEHVGATASIGSPPDYDHDLNQIILGNGETCFKHAKTALKSWAMFPSDWTRIFPRPIPVEDGEVVVVLFRLFGLWWLNSCRIVYTFDEKHRFGFAYGTLPGHVEQGEECFWIEMDEYGVVWYRIKAFSRPAVLATKIGYPFARHFQRRFVKDSFESIKKFLQKTGP